MPSIEDVSQTLLGIDWWDATTYPVQVPNQRFGMVLTDKDLSPLSSDSYSYKGLEIRPRIPSSVKASGTSEVKIDDNWFRIILDVPDFKLEDLDVKIEDRFVEINGKHDERKDQHGLVARNFCRRYMVPNNCDTDRLTCCLSTDGKLKITAPRLENRTLMSSSIEIKMAEKKTPGDTPMVKKEDSEITPTEKKENLESKNGGADEKP